jgi:2-phosphoglycerate kinase
MKKTEIIRSQQDEPVPFFRGILVKSLVDIDISFDDAYDLANQVRDDLRDVPKITTEALSDMVASLVEAQFGKDKRDRYELIHRQNARIMVVSEEQRECFSLGMLRHSLKACAIPEDTAAAAALKVQEILHTAGHYEVTDVELRSTVYHCLRDHFSLIAADRYLSWRHFKHSGIPLVLLIGGSPGVGKSTIATELAYRFNIARLQSTDMMREVIRSYLTPAVAPTLQYSSFEAWEGLPVARQDSTRPAVNRVVEGFLSQVSIMQPALNAAIDRALQEGESLILEGVHVLPGELDLKRISKRAVVISLVLSSIKKGSLRGRLRSRGGEGGDRNPDRYLDHMDEIWQLQSFLIGEAEAADVTVQPTANIGSTINEILDLTTRQVMDRCPPDPEWS